MSKARAFALVARAARVVVWVLLRLLPARRHAVVHGWPDSEGNAVEVVRALARRYPGHTYWLLSDPACTGPSGVSSELADGRVVRLPKTSPRAVLMSLTAQLTFFTHGLYTAVGQPDDRLVVNLWHGDGPKTTRDSQLVRSSVVVSQTRLWGEYKADLFRVPRESLALVGNPRVDQFDEPLPPAAAARLGLDDARPRVVWLPTYRQARGPRARVMHDAEHLTGDSQVRELVTALSETAERLGLDLVVKPHPLDVDDYSGMGVRVLRNSDLDAAGVGLYQLLGRCSALISDVSSVWVDYLVLDRPIAFYVPDLAELQRRRGLNVPDFDAVAPGPQLRTPQDGRLFLEQVATGAAARPSERPEHARLGVVTGTGAADRLLDWLDEHQRRRGRSALFVPGP